MARTKQKAIPRKYVGLNQIRQLNLLKTTTSTIEELKNFLLLSFGLLLDVESKETLDVIELVNEKRIIEKLETVNKISNVKDKEQQLFRLAIQEGSNSLKSNVYFEYLENYNGDIIKPTQSSKPNIKFNESLWLYTQYYFNVNGLKYLIDYKNQGTKIFTRNYYHIKPNITKDQLVHYLTVYYNQTGVNYGVLFFDIVLFHIISGNIIDCTSLESMLELFKVIYGLLKSNSKIDNFIGCISKVFGEYIQLFNTNYVYDVNQEVVQDLIALQQLPLDKYKWLINHCNSVIQPFKSTSKNSFEAVNVLYMCIDSKELVDFIFNYKSFYNLISIKKITHPIISISQLRNINFGSFEIAQYFENELSKVIQSNSLLTKGKNKEEIWKSNVYSNHRQFIYKSLFFKSILNCDIQEMKKFVELVPPLNLKRDIVQQKEIKKKPVFNCNQQTQKDKFTKEERDQILQSKFYLDQESRNSFLNLLNSNNFKCFTYSSFNYLKNVIEIDPTTSTSTSTITGSEFENQYSNFTLYPYLSMEYILNSIYNLNFKSVEMILNLPNFKLSLSDIETIIMNERTQFSFEITRGTYQSKFEYLDIKKMLLSLIKVLPLPELNSSIQYIYFHLYKCLLQSIGIEMNNLIEIHNIYNSIGITNEILFNNNQVFHLIYWIHLKSKKLSKVLSLSDKFGRDHIYNLISTWGYTDNIESSDGVFAKIDTNQPQLQFDFIYNCNTNNSKDIKTILVAFTKKKSEEEEEDEPDYQMEQEIEESIQKENENSLLYQDFSLYLFHIDELDLYLDIIKQYLKDEEKEEKWFYQLYYENSYIIADSNKLEEFISLANIAKVIKWYIKGAIFSDRIDIMEKLFSIYPTETIESFNQNDNLEAFLNYNSILFFKYMFENHYSIIYNHFKKQMKNEDSNLHFSTSTNCSGKRKAGGTSPFFIYIVKCGVDLCELLLKHIPHLFKFTPSLILLLLEHGQFSLIQYYLEIGTIQNNDFSVESIELLKSLDDLKFLKWVVDL